MFLFFLMFIFFLCILQAKKENEPYPKGHPDSYGSYLAYDSSKERNRRLSKETVKCFIKDFATTSCGQNLLKTQLFLAKVPSGLRPEPPYGLLCKPCIIKQ